MKALWLSLALAAGAVSVQSPAFAAGPHGIPPQHKIHGIIIHRCHPRHGVICHKGPLGLVIRHHGPIGVPPATHHVTTVPQGGFTHGIPVEQHQGGGAVEH